MNYFKFKKEFFFFDFIQKEFEGYVWLTMDFMYTCVTSKSKFYTPDYWTKYLFLLQNFEMLHHITKQQMLHQMMYYPPHYKMSIHFIQNYKCTINVRLPTEAVNCGGIVRIYLLRFKIILNCKLWSDLFKPPYILIL